MIIVNEKWTFPGAAALIPCVGTALVIWGASTASSWPSLFLSTLPFRFFGAISYSLYLVHWPVVVFASRLFPHADSTHFLIIGVLISTILGYISYAIIETPTRRKIVFSSRKSIFIASGSSLILFIGVSLTTLHFQGFSGRISESIGRIIAYQTYDYKDMFREGTCFLRPEQHPSSFDTVTCVPRGSRSVLLWGDSHMAHFYFGLMEPAATKGYFLGQMTSSACPPTPGVVVANRPNCAEFNDFAIKEIIDSKPGMVVMGAFWDASDEQLMMLDRAIEDLRKADISVVVFGPSPVYKGSVPKIVAQRIRQANASSLSGLDLESESVLGIDARMKKYLSDRDDITYISVIDTVCNEGQCPITVGGVPVHFDSAHLTREGSILFGQKLALELFSEKNNDN